MDDLKTGRNNNWPSNRDPDAHSGDRQRLQWREKFAKSDAVAGIEVTDNFERFGQMNDMSSRAFWDETVRNKKSDAFFSGHRVAANPRKTQGFQQRDLTLRNAGWLNNLYMYRPAN